MTFAALLIVGFVHRAQKQTLSLSTNQGTRSTILFPAGGSNFVLEILQDASFAPLKKLWTYRIQWLLADFARGMGTERRPLIVAI
jgi:hypothetical protein